MAISKVKTNANRRRHDYPDDYVKTAFILWYNNGKPSPAKLYEMVNPLKETGLKPGVPTLANWIHDEFAPLAFYYDEDVSQQLRQNLVAEKVEMFDRHAKLGKQMQTIGIEYLEEYGVKNARDAIRMVVEGNKIERDSSGLSTTIERISKWSDEKLLSELESAALAGPIIDIEPND